LICGLRGKIPLLNRYRLKKERKELIYIEGSPYNQRRNPLLQYFSRNYRKQMTMNGASSFFRNQELNRERKERILLTSKKRTEK